MLLIREIMYCKPGKVRPMVDKFLKMSSLNEKAGYGKVRVMTDKQRQCRDPRRPAQRVLAESLSKMSRGAVAGVSRRRPSSNVWPSFVAWISSTKMLTICESIASRSTP